MSNKTQTSLWRFGRFACSSMASTLVDQLVAWTLFAVLREHFVGADFLRILLASCIARCVSMSVNFFINNKVVFKNGNLELPRRKRESFPRFALLQLSILSLSSLGVWMAHTGFGVAEWQAKPFVDFCLFFLNYNGQRKWVFAERPTRQTAVA